MKATVTKSFEFEAAHRLPYHDGHCRRPHGHSYKLEVSVEGVVLDRDGESNHGMVMDFSVMSDVVKGLVILNLDHRDLNEVTGIYTTCENLAGWIWSKVDGPLKDFGVRLVKVRLSETRTGWVEVTREDMW